jgi:vancomycin resistance protein YoaR
MSKKKRLGIGLIALAVFLLAILTLNSYTFWYKNYRDRVYPGVSVSNLNLGGKTLDQARETLSGETKKIETAGLVFQTGAKQVNIAATVASFDADLSYPAIAFDIEETLKNIFADRLNNSFTYYLLTKLQPKKNKQVKINYSLDEEKIKTQLLAAFPELEIAASNAYFSLDGPSVKNDRLKSNPEKLGKEINYDQLFAEIRINLDRLRNAPLLIKTRTKYPEVRQSDLTGLEAEAKRIIGQDNLLLKFTEPGEASSTEKIWTIKPERLITWVSAQKNKNELSLILDLEKIKQYLRLNAAPEIDREAIMPRFEIKNGKVINWQTGTNGRRIALEENAAKISQEFLNGQKEIFLIIKEIRVETSNTNNDLDIKEIIGTGHSNFSGSPENRRKNIRVGAAAVHGILIKPDEEFSLVKTLGEISAETGYFPELVIKGNKTVPEYGGGLCQIGTTIFRSALASGLPITARQSHSYRVSYYEPAGMDAAVYIPNPDVRFINDTGNYILIQARIIKNDIYFDFWGVKDGRVASTSKPVVYNIVKPGPTKLIESPDLAPGQKKCTESAHNGADAYFDYMVIYPEGATTTPIQERRFKSHYVPWQAVCLIGAEAATSSAAIMTAATSTPIIPVSSSSPATSTN